jgi:hypothetical protein
MEVKFGDGKIKFGVTQVRRVLAVKFAKNEIDRPCHKGQEVRPLQLALARSILNQACNVADWHFSDLARCPT